MKILAALLFTLFCSSTFAGPGDGPIVPWPTSLRESLIVEDIQGSWIGYSHNAVWFVDIYSAVGIDDVVVVRMTSQALFTKKAQGLLTAEGGLFAGEVKADANHRTSLLLFKDGEGTTLRIADTNKRFHDMRLYRAKPGVRYD